MIFSVFSIALLVSFASQVETAVLANSTIAEGDKEYILVSSLVSRLLEQDLPRCSLYLDTDSATLSPEVQGVFYLMNRQYRSVTIGRMHPSFALSFADYPGLWRQDQLHSFRTLPPQLRGGTWPGGECVLNMILVHNTSTFNNLVLHAATSVAFRNMDDPTYIHFRSNKVKPKLLMSDPAKGIAFKVMSQYLPNLKQLRLHNVCYYCNSGEDMLNPPILYPRHTLGREYMFPTPPLTYNGKNLIVAHFENIDVAGARERAKNSSAVLSYEEMLMLALEKFLDAKIRVVLPQLSMEEVESNGSYTGLTGAVLYGKADFALAQVYTSDTIRVNALPCPLLYVYLSFATRQPRPDMKWYIMFQPYTLGMWIGILVTTIVSALVNSLIERHEIAEGDNRRLVSLYWKNLGRVARELLGQPLEEFGYSETRTFFAFFSLFAIVIVGGYEAKIVSLLTYPEREILPENVEELINSKMSIGTILFLKIILSSMVEKSEELARYRPFVKNAEVLPDFYSCFAKSISHDFACFSIDYYYNKEKSNFIDSKGNMEILWALDRALSFYTGPAYGNDNVGFQRSKKMLRLFFESNIIPKRRELLSYANFLRRTNALRKHHANKKEKIDEVLTFKKLSFIIYLWMIGLGLSLSVFFFEFCPVKPVRSNSRHGQSAVPRSESQQQKLGNSEGVTNKTTSQVRSILSDAATIPGTVEATSLPVQQVDKIHRLFVTDADETNAVLSEEDKRKCVSSPCIPAHTRYPYLT